MHEIEFAKPSAQKIGDLKVGQLAVVTDPAALEYFDIVEAPALFVRAYKQLVIVNDAVATWTWTEEEKPSVRMLNVPCTILKPGDRVTIVAGG